MTMTRREFVDLADTLARSRDWADPDTVDGLARALCGPLRRSNHRFNADRFLTAAGVGAPRERTEQQQAKADAEALAVVDGLAASWPSLRTPDPAA